MPTIMSLRPDALMDENRGRLEFDGSAELSFAYNMYSVCCHLVVTDDATRDMPARPIETVTSPGKQGASAIVLDQQVDVDERRDPADKEKHLVGQSVCSNVNMALELADQLR